MSDALTTNSKVVSKDKLLIGMVAGEASGDILGASLIKSLKERYPNAEFEGIGGPLMLSEGFRTQVPMERLSVMGLVEVLGRLFELIGIRRRIKKYFIAKRPAIFIGIDAPDFNLGLEEKLRKSHIKTSHYVSPSVWAWRQKRVYKIARAVDLMLTLLPFEARFYQDHKVRVKFVGHPLADIIPLATDKYAARASLGLSAEEALVAILPGSRAGEVKYIGESFIAAARHINEARPDIRFIIPCVNQARREQIQALVDEFGGDLPISLIDGQSRALMAASDFVLLASGTAALEAMLLKKPMVVSYRVAWLTHMIMKRLLKVPFVSLPNLLAGKELVPELLQDAAEPKKIAQAALRLMSPEVSAPIVSSFDALHQSLKLNASEEAADAIVEVIQGKVEP